MRVYTAALPHFEYSDENNFFNVDWFVQRGHQGKKVDKQVRDQYQFQLSKIQINVLNLTFALSSK